ncbi:GntG family PLP-dependent aldolase [Aquipuribacter nitratireducens]|uniref:Threonine aldolase family protein n=1 Tax=Aquipuribacter nitratireducens TaxID=650104 RepID=A0ABW0GQN4_9MICO
MRAPARVGDDTAHDTAVDAVDLRSDTLTRPTPAMRQAMAEAEVGDDVYGEDPTLVALEERVAELLGHEAGLFFPSGSMANMVGVRLLVPPGTELLADVTSHVLRAELGGHAALGGVSSRTWSDGVVDGTNRARRLDAAVPLALMAPDAGPYLVSTAAVAVENTHNFGGGTVQPLTELELLRAGTAEAGVAVHLDGARLWNAHVAAGVPLATYGRLADTVSVCLSKGLGAPVGSVLVASRERIAQARVLRKRYGGGMRQAGVLAAACLHALDHHVGRLAEDHARARRIAEACHAAAPGSVDPRDVETNIVVLATGDRPGAEVAALAAGKGVRVSSLGPRMVRVVTHLDVDDADVDRACEVLAAVLTG